MTEWIKIVGVECPKCGSDDITISEWYTGEDRCWWELECRKCGHRWKVYKKPKAIGELAWMIEY